MQRDKFFKEIENVRHPNETFVKTHCACCGMQCGMNLRVNTQTNKIVGLNLAMNGQLIWEKCVLRV